MTEIAKTEILKEYILANVAPILLTGFDLSSFNEVEKIESNCDTTLVNGYYEGTSFFPPTWFTKIKQKEKEKLNILLIDKLDKISKKEQLKFTELLKYRKINTFNLPSNCVIILTAETVSSETIAKEIYSLVAHI
jgi:hypothetical protein